MSLQSYKNTFEKGMTKDYSVIYQPQGSYRHCVNCSLISQDGNNYVIKDCLGNVKTFSINIPYDEDETTFGVPPSPIGFISFPDTLIVFSTNNNTENGGYGEIGIINYQPYGEGVAPVIVAGNMNNGYVPLYHHTGLNFTTLQQIEGFGFQENEAIKRIYWTDDFNEPRVLNISDPIYTTYIADGALIVGKQYMVLEGVIEHNGQLYGPTTINLSGLLKGNIFTAVNANYIATTGTTPIPKVIGYMPLQLLNFTPSRSLGNIRVVGGGAGSLWCGNKMYFYRLVNSTEGIFTSWSYGTFPVPVRLGGIGAYFSDVGGGTPTTLVNSAKSNFIVVSSIDTAFERIQIAVAEFDQLLEVPRNIAIILDEAITSSEMEFVHDSNTNLGTLTIADLTLFPASILTCKTMTTNKNYNLIANIKERGEFNFDVSGVTVEQIDYKMPAHRNVAGGDPLSCPNVMSYDPIGYAPFTNPTGANAIPPYSKWVVANAAGGDAVYNGNSYGAGEVIEGVPGVFTIFIPVGTSVWACVSTNKYTTTGGDPRPSPVTLSSGYWDYKDPIVANSVKGLWDHEKYRYGVLFFDKKGNPFYVKHLMDLDTNRDFTTNPITFTENDNVSDIMYINQTGAKISGLTIEPELAAMIYGFSIVMAPRDARIITQGMLYQTSESQGVVSGLKLVQPNATYISNRDLAAADSPGFYSLLCPDHLVQFPMSNFVDGQPGTNATSIEEAFWLTPRNQANSGTIFIKSDSLGNEEFETKYFESLPGDANSPRIKPIYTQYTVSENQDIRGFFGGNTVFTNKTFMKSVTVDSDCFSVGTTHVIPSDTVSAGGLRLAIEIIGDNIPELGSSVLYSAITFNNSTKMMVNVTVSKANQYGGNSPASLAATNYISTGHYQEITPAVLSDTITGGGNYVFNDIEVWGGDAFTCLVDYAYAIFDDVSVKPTDGSPAAGSYGFGIKFPCQCNANYTLRTGAPKRSIAPDYMQGNFPGNGIFFRIGTDSQLEGFQYNQGYSSDGNVFLYPALPIDFSLSNIFRYRIRFAGPKFPGELINSFRTFLINDYKDTDGHGGEINNLRTKDGRTVVFQNAGIDTVPILERQVVSADTGDATAIGTGGVVDRFDPVSTYFGNQHQWGLTATEYGWCWFDMKRKAVVTLNFSEGVAEISKINGLEGFFDEAILEVIGNSSPISNNILNDPTFSKYSDRPWTGVGITGVYDPKFKMTYLTFKFIQRNATTAYNKDFTIGYSHTDKFFVGFYDWTPAIAWNHNQIVLSANNPKNKLTYFADGMPSTNFVVGDIVPYLNKEWICISPVTIATYPGSVTTAPDVPGSTFWVEINRTNELWVNNQPRLLGQAIAPDYMYNSVFGQVVNNVFEWVVNPPQDNAFSVLNMEQEGNNVNFTDITISTESQTASDTSISPTSRFYRVIWDKICSNFPFSSTGRITNSYLVARYTKKNWDTDPRVVSRGVKILRSITSFFEPKR